MPGAFHFSGHDVINAAGDDILENLAGGSFVDANSNPIPIYDWNGNPLTEITTNAFGLSSRFTADVVAGYIKFGGALNFVACDETPQMALAAQGAIDTANQAITIAQQALALASSIPSGGVTDHGQLSGLSDDDHPQYHTDARGDARYYTKALADSALSAAVTTSSAADRDRNNHTGTQSSSSISDFATAVQANVTNRLRFDAVQTLTTAQQNQAKANMGVSNLSGLTIAAARLSTDPVLTDSQALALYGEGAFFTVDPA